MGAQHLIAWLVIGLIAGFLAGKVVDGGGFGILGDMVVGLIGAFIGGLILNVATGNGDSTSNFLGEALVAFLGAVVLLAALRALGRGRRGSHGGTAAFRR